MAAEAIHLSALEDSARSPILDPELRDFLARPEIYAAARFGAVFIDFPYLRGFARKALRYGLGLAQPASLWGDRYHQDRPVALGRALLAAAERLNQSRPDQAQGELILALALGYFTHLAVDTETHVHVNRMARERAAITGRESDHHQTIEKLHSVFFHHDRIGFDFLGHPAVRHYIRVDSTWLVASPTLFSAWQQAHNDALGEAPDLSETRRWIRGYRLYSRVVSGFIGRRLSSPEEKEREYSRLYQGEDFSFPKVYKTAVERCCLYLQVAWRASKGQPFDEHAVPERNIDEPELLFR